MSEIHEEKQHKNLWITASVGSFILVICFIFFLFNAFGISPLYSAILGLIAGAFVVFIIMSINGMLKQFTIKSPFFEMTSILKDRIESVQTDVKESKREIGIQLTSLNHNIQSINSRIDNVMTH